MKKSLKQIVSSKSGLYYGLPVLLNGILGSVLALLGVLFFAGRHSGAAASVLEEYSEYNSKYENEYLSFLSYKKAASNMDCFLLIGIVLIIIGIIIWIASGMINPKKNNVIRILLWTIPLAIVLLTAIMLYAPCLSYIINYE